MFLTLKNVFHASVVFDRVQLDLYGTEYLFFDARDLVAIYGNTKARSFLLS